MTNAELAARSHAILPRGGLLLRVAVVFVLAIFIGEGVAHAVFGIGAWTLEDLDAYWDAAVRLREGEALYARFDPDASVVYRYTPWFAYAWIPLTHLPRMWVEVAWSAILVAASVGAAAPLLRRPTPAAIALAGLLGPFLLWTASRGNVQPLLVAGLVHGVERRSGPLWVALAASLKAVPILFVLVYVGRRQWARAGLALAVAGLLGGHMLLFDLAAYTTDPGGSQSLLFLSPVAWAGVALASLTVAAVVAWRRSRFAWLGAAVAAMAVLPRFFLYDLTYLLVPAAPQQTQASEPSPHRS